MATFVKVNDTLYPATINGRMQDYEWDNRETKEIIMENTYDGIKALFADGVSWSIVMPEQKPKTDSTGNPLKDSDGNIIYETVNSEWDNSEFNLAGPITDYRDGRVSIKMGKTTDLEDAYAMMIGG